jgi:hypothetical protein
MPESGRASFSRLQRVQFCLGRGDVDGRAGDHRGRDQRGDQQKQNPHTRRRPVESPTTRSGASPAAPPSSTTTSTRSACRATAQQALSRGMATGAGGTARRSSTRRRAPGADVEASYAHIAAGGIGPHAAVVVRSRLGEPRRPSGRRAPGVGDRLHELVRRRRLPARRVRAIRARPEHRYLRAGLPALRARLVARRASAGRSDGEVHFGGDEASFPASGSS